MPRTILLVEDEDQVRLMLERVLAKNDFVVVSAANGRDALTRVADRLNDIDLVVTDLVMPEMGGIKMMQQLRAQRPDISVLYMTGYADEAIQEEGSLEEGAQMIKKPFTPTQLMTRMREVM
jgi:CheY-like chemotaxis protein